MHFARWERESKSQQNIPIAKLCVYTSTGFSEVFNVFC